MSLREDRILRRLLRRRAESRLKRSGDREYKALSAVGRPLPACPVEERQREARMIPRKKYVNPLKKAKRIPRGYVPLAERFDWDGEIEVLESEED